MQADDEVVLVRDHGPHALHGQPKRRHGLPLSKGERPLAPGDLIPRGELPACLESDRLFALGLPPWRQGRHLALSRPSLFRAQFELAGTVSNLQF